MNNKIKNCLLVLSIMSLVVSLSLKLSQEISKKYFSNIESSYKKIDGKVLSGIYANFSYIQEWIMFNNLHNFDAHKNVEMAEKQEMAILNKRKEILISYFNIAESTFSIEKEIDDIISKNISFDSKFSELINIQERNAGMIQKNIFNKEYLKIDELKLNLSGSSCWENISSVILIILCGISTLLTIFVKTDKKEVTKNHPIAKESVSK